MIKLDPYIIVATNVDAELWNLRVGPKLCINLVEGHFLGFKWKAKGLATRAAKVWQTSGKTIRPKRQK